MTLAAGRSEATLTLARHHVAGLTAIACATAVTWASALGAGFVLDSRGIIVGNAVIHTATFENLRFILTHDYTAPLAVNGLYRPLTVLSYLFDWAILGHGDHPAGYIAENILLHFICAALVYALVWQLVGRFWPALVAAGLFALHPVTTEAVTNVVGRADLLATLGVLGGLLCYARGIAARGGGRAGWAAGLVVASGCAFFAKEGGLVLVAAIALWDLAFTRFRFRLEHVLVALVLAVYLVSRWLVMHYGLPAEDLSPLENPLVEAGFWTGRLTAVWVVARELALVVWPGTLSADYSYREIPVVSWPPLSPADWGALCAVAVLVLVPWGLLRLRRGHPAAFFLAAFAAVALLPTSNFVRLIGSIMAERFLYLPLAGLAGLAALLAERVAAGSRRRTAVNAVVGLVLVACAARTVTRNRDWRDDLTLWAAAVRDAPGSAKVHAAYAGAYFDADAAHDNLGLVIAEAERAIAIRPDYRDTLADLGGYYLLQGDRVAATAPGEARSWYEKAVAVLDRARPLDERAAARFTAKMLARGHARDQIPDFGTPTLWNNLGLANERLARHADALAAYEELRRLDPSSAATYVDISVPLLALNRWEDAAVALFQGILVAPQEEDAAQRLAEVYRTFYPDGDAIVSNPSGRTQINLNDPVVHRHRCRAWSGLASIFARAMIREAAASAREQAKASCAGERDAS